MTRILRIIETADPRYGGPLESARRMGEAWARTEHVQDLLTLDPPDERHLADYPGEIIALGPPRGRSLRQRYRYAPKMVPWLRAHARDYDAVIVSGLWRYHARGAMLALAGGPTPYFVFAHGMLDPWFRRSAPLKHCIKQLSWWVAEGPLLANARAVLFTSEEECRLAEGAFWPYRVQPAVVGYGAAEPGDNPAAQMAAFREALPALGERRFLLFLSRVHPKKGCDLLIDAFAGIAGGHPDLDLVIAGPDQAGLGARLRAQAERLGIANRVHFPGMLSGDAKIGALRAAGAFVLPSHQENFGVVVAEAMACGTPVLISDKVNIWREVVEDGAGLAESDTLAGTQALLDRFLAMPEAGRRTMGGRARTAYLARFQVDRAANHLISFIKSRI